ncbi:MAG TPA: PAS domain S-box protein [Syntrophorhabdaceae bacterium]|nr:PAS domain S-box protein [Syntrophorhabdaceae bacterium]
MEKTEERFMEQLQLFRALMDNLPNPVYYKNTSGVYLGYNKAFQEYFGLKSAHHIGKTVFDLPISRDEAILHHRIDSELLQLSGSREYEASVTGPDGSVRYTISRKAVFRRADGGVGGIIGVVTDITEAKKVEESLRETNARLQDLSEASFEAIIFIENDTIVDANGTFYELFGFEGGEVIGEPVLSIIAQDMRKEGRRIVEAADDSTYELVGVKKNGTYFPMEVHPREIYARGRNLKIAVIRDISERKHMEEEVLKSKNLQSIGTLAGGIAHDFNNLLMAIVGNLSLAKMNVPPDAKISEFLSEAERIVFMGKSLTQQLLTFSRAGDPVRKTVHLGPLLREVTEKVVKGSSVRPRYFLPSDLFPVEIDEERMRQAIENIVLNAKDAMSSGGTLVISCENVSVTPQDKLPLIKENHVKISVRDEGVGIPEENLSKIFDPYFTTKALGSQKGVGLGLSICYSIIRSHNGYIQVDSSPGAGAVFQIYLPAGKKENSEQSAEDKPERHNKGRVLIMDDEEMILKIARELLQGLASSISMVLHVNCGQYISHDRNSADCSVPLLWFQPAFFFV